MNVGQLVCRHRRPSPNGLALIEPATGRQLTWRALDERSSNLAGALVGELGLHRGDRVTMLARNCLEYFELYIACAKAGCIAHGMNWRFAAPAMAAALEDTAPSLILVQDDFAEQATELQREVDVPHWRSFGSTSDGSYEDLLDRGRHHVLEPAGGDDDALLIVYTGGTTGDSKGAVHSHATIGTAMANNTIAERIMPTDRYMLLGQAFHSAAILALNYLRHGCPVVVVNFEPAPALEAIDEYGVTAFLGFPTMLTYMLEEGTSARFSLETLRNIQYGGGAFPESIVFSLLDTFPCSLIQCYGTSESVGVTFLSQEDHVRARRERSSLLRSCGLPAFLTEVRLVADESDRSEVAGHRVGEIHVRSRSNMLGYWNEWKEHGPSRQPEWLPTGDLAYVDDDGYLYIVGRAKDVIISGGENIYAPHVEDAIFKHPAVLEAAVIGVPDTVWGEAVSAFVVLRSGRSATEAEIQEWVRMQLGSYQKPKTVTFMDALPKTPTGKVMKRALNAETTGRSV